MTELLGIIIAVTQISGYYFYYKSVQKGVKPNTTSWTIWTFGNLLEILSYIYLTGDWVKNLLPIACGFASILLYVHCLFYGKFKKLKKEDWVLIGTDTFATVLWYITASALVANAAYLISTIISFIPIIREIYDEDENETLLPWGIWSGAYFMAIVLVFLRWEKWEDLMYPIVYFILHFIVFILIFLFKKKNNSKNNISPPKNLNYSYLENYSKDKKYDIEDHLYVAKSKIAGKGLFTHKEHKKDEKVFVMKGPLLEFYPKNKEEALHFPNVVGVRKNIWIDPVAPYEFINHTCNPNLATDEDGVSFTALRDIEANEELTFDYSISEYSDWEMPCSCGYENCRKTIKSIDNLPVNFYKKYYPYIPHYFQKIYLKKYIENNK